MKNRRFVQVMDGLYTAGAKVRSTDPYYAKHTAFMSVLGYKNPRSSFQLQKLSLLEQMGIIADRAQQIEFLKRNLPPYGLLGPKYTVELVLDGEVVETLKNGETANGAMLRLEFVGSLYRSGPLPGFY